MKIKDTWHLPDQKQAARRTKSEIPVIDGLRLSEAQKHLGDGKKAYISTYGCQANERDSENLYGILEACGYRQASSAQEADLILMNTCGIRENAANNVLGETGSYKRLFKNNPNLLIGICGCMAQEEGFVRTLLEKYPWVHLLFGTHNIHQLPAYIERVQNGEKVVEVYSREGEIYEHLPEKRTGKTKAWVNIMYGCDKFCTYCIVPYTRGRQRSRQAQDILAEVQALIRLGYREVTLLGQNVNAYGKDLTDSIDFAGLLCAVADTGIDRVRFMTSHPWDFSDAMIEAIASRKNIMPYIHLPLQSGDDEILRRMGRRYTSAQYLELFDKIRQRIPGAAISTDIIVGFPDESDEAFEHTLDVVRHCAFDNAFTFIYSPRPGTPAARMDDPVDLETKKQRLYRLNELWNQLANEKNQRLVGTVIDVLIEGPSRKDPSVFTGYSDTGKPVNVRGQGLEEGMIVPVEIVEAKTFSLNGRIAAR